MNLVERIARMIDAEGAYYEAFNGTGPEAQKHDFTVRQKYFQANYELRAIEILNLLRPVGKDKIRNDLIEWEKFGWKRLGVPIDDPKFKEMADGIIEREYA